MSSDHRLTPFLRNASSKVLPIVYKQRLISICHFWASNVKLISIFSLQFRTYTIPGLNRYPLFSLRGHMFTQKLFIVCANLFHRRGWKISWQKLLTGESSSFTSRFCAGRRICFDRYNVYELHRFRMHKN